jgi:hypothetical protein
MLGGGRHRRRLGASLRQRITEEGRAMLATLQQLGVAISPIPQPWVAERKSFYNFAPSAPLLSSLPLFI